MVNCEGWTCPTCRRNYAPWMPSCSCINSAVGVSTTSITITPHADDTAELVGVLQELRARFHAAGRRPEECYEMSLIDEALARVKGGERS